MSALAEVRLWGARLGGVFLPEQGGGASFEYDPSFAASGLEVAPLRMPLASGITYRFGELIRTSFEGLPGLLSDSLPDRYGNALIDAWLATVGRTPESFDVVERLCYVGSRGMGALQFRPALGPESPESESVDLEALIELASELLAARGSLRVDLQRPDRKRALEEILRVGSSAGGARAKALIAFDSETGEVRSGQLGAPPGFRHWILKFDGVSDRRREIGSLVGYGAIEYVYAELAARAGIEMTECRLLEEGGRRHFMTRRFDRTDDGGRVHMQSLAALAHLDYELAGAHSYEQAFEVIRRLRLTMHEREQMFRRAAFNVIARNQDDHVKNIAFIMDQTGAWSLAPAFDLVYAFNPEGRWTAHHQMSINGKLDDFRVEDLRHLAASAGLRRGRDSELLGEVTEAVASWPEQAAATGIETERIEAIAATHRLELGRS